MTQETIAYTVSRQIGLLHAHQTRRDGGLLFCSASCDPMKIEYKW